MRKVNLRMNEQKKYDVIKKLVDTNGNKKRAAVELGLSERQINRLIIGYLDKGKEFFMHGNRNRIPINKVSFEIRQDIVDLYTTKYSDCNFTFFRELLSQRENINVSLPTIISIMYDENIVSPLHAVIDDATSQVIGAYFDKEETLNGYYQITKQFLLKYGIPVKIKADNRTVFNYKRKNNPSDEDDTLTQYGYACKQLGIAIETSSIPEFKARIERVFQTFQNRLPKLFELNGIHSIEDANKFISEYLTDFNKQFALPINNTKSVFENQLDEEKINLTLSILSNRIINSGHTIHYHNKEYKTIDKSGKTIYYGKGTKCMVIKTFDNKLYASVESELFELEEVPIREEVSANFDETKQIKLVKRNIPNMLHPWKAESFNKYIEKQKHRQIA